MGRRSAFERIGKDFYRTFDPRAVAPLLPHLSPGTRYVEPCCGSGDLIAQLDAAGHRCVEASDIDPSYPLARVRDVLEVEGCRGDVFITNPPWSRAILHSLIAHLSAMAPTWLLFDAAWMHTRQAAPFEPFCHAVISVGRVRWIPGTKDDGKDDAAWYLFDRTRRRQTAAPVVYWRAA